MDNGKTKIITKKIKVFGIVQGVGFRPLVYRIAKKYKMNGTVQNVGGFVEITVQSTEDEINYFLRALKEEQCGGCEITKMEATSVKEENFCDFKIINSKDNDEISIIPPDLPVCSDCEKELYKEEDRRFLNPFISCMSCGPRYTIMEELPYDRHNTTMKDFVMCPDCNEEYRLPESRRFHAQTISCYDCGPYLIYQEMTGLKKTKKSEKEWKEAEAFKAAVTCIKSGGIVAVKGIGGYHFVCSPFIEDTVRNLRTLKGREEKPFAVMFESLEAIQDYCIVSKEEEALLLSKARPIVLLLAHQYSQEGKIKPSILPMAPSTNKESLFIGSFLPYTPLQILLTKELGPLIMTSANQSDRPVIKDDCEISSPDFNPYLNGILYNHRRILRSVDDSVIKIVDGQSQLIRRSRGYVPYPVFLDHKENNNLQIIAAGGDLKAAFCLYKGGNAVVSQYFGDLEEVAVMQAYKESVADLLRLLKITPELAVCDLHPNYHSTDFVKSLQIPILQVQHHHAHIASVMAEHTINRKVIGIAFDGTGYGTDGNIWGGEFLICEGADYERAAHLSYTPILGGDNSMRDAKKTATCFLINAGLSEYINDERKVMIQAALKNKINTVDTSSMGRLFDAVASILNLKQENKYEGECAVFLEREAYLAFHKDSAYLYDPEELSFAIQKKSGIIEINPGPVLETLIKNKETVSSGLLALKFHYAVADAIGKVCDILRKEYHTDAVALSGGVFQNTILTERTIKVLKNKGFCVYKNQVVPPNDGSISLGQTYIGLHKK